MRIGIDLRSLDGNSRSRGIGVFTHSLIRSLLKVSSEATRYSFFIQVGSKIKKEFTNKNVSFIPVPTIFRPLKAIRKLDPLVSFFWRRALKKGQVNLLHIPSLLELFYVSVPDDIKTIVTIYDLIPLIYKDRYFKNRRAYEYFFKRLLQVKKAAHVITISEDAKKSIVRILKIPPKKISVIYGGIDPRFKFIKRSKKHIAEKYQITDPFVLAVGAPSFHKNIERLFEAFKTYKDNSKSSVKLVIVCKLIRSEHAAWEKKIYQLGLKKDVYLTNFIASEELPFFYSAAQVFIYPSLYEGFGLPILEAFATHTPVITSNCSSMPEAGGKAAFYIEPKNSDQIAQAISRVLKDKALRKKMVALGIKQLKKFSWEKTARETLGVYKMISNL